MSNSGYQSLPLSLSGIPLITFLLGKSSPFPDYHNPLLNRLTFLNSFLNTVNIYSAGNKTYFTFTGITEEEIDQIQSLTRDLQSYISLNLEAFGVSIKGNSGYINQYGLNDTIVQKYTQLESQAFATNKKIFLAFEDTGINSYVDQYQGLTSSVNTPTKDKVKNYSLVFSASTNISSQDHFGGIYNPPNNPYPISPLISSV